MKRLLTMLQVAAAASLLQPMLPASAQGVAAPAPAIAPTDVAASAPFEGRVEAYLLSPEAGVAGLLFDDGRQVRVPPHLGAALAALVKPGQRARVGTPISENGNHGHAPLRQITEVDSGKTLADEPVDTAEADRSASLTGPTALQPLASSGAIRHTLLGPRGEVNGVVLDNGVQVAFPPHVMREASDRLVAGTRIVVKGYGRTSNFGTIVQATEISGAGMSPLSIYGPSERR